MNYRMAVFSAFLLAAVPAITTLPGCAGKLNSASKSDENALVIPDFPTARDQYEFARVYQNSQLISPELDKRRIQMSKVSECYQRVLTNFPNDAEYVPKTYLELGDCAAQSDEMEKAVGYYQQAQARSQDAFIHARAQYSIGRVYDAQKRFEEAKAIYKGIMDQYGKNESGHVRDVVVRAARLYYQVQDTSQMKKKTD